MQYEYVKSPIDYDRLTQEIRDSAIVTALDYISGENGTTIIHFKASISDEDKAVLDGIINSHSGIPLEPIIAPREVVISPEEKTSTGHLMVATYEAEGDASTICSHNFADPCSWFQHSLPMTNEVLINTTENTFKGSKVFWIDLFNGRVFDEDNVVLQNPGKYDVKVYVDGVKQAAGTYLINYEEGTITFNSPVSGVVTASYYYSDKSYYAIRPRAGKILSIDRTEVQFSVGTRLLAPFVFEAWANLVHPVYGAISVAIPNTKSQYKNAKDFISACNLGQGIIPAFAELQKDVQVFPFDYVRPKPLRYSQGVEIRVYCKDHLPVTDCEFATVAFYVTIDNE